METIFFITDITCFFKKNELQYLYIATTVLRHQVKNIVAGK